MTKQEAQPLGPTEWSAAGLTPSPTSASAWRWARPDSAAALEVAAEERRVAADGEAERAAELEDVAEESLLVAAAVVAVAAGAGKRTAFDQQRTPSWGSRPSGQTTPGIEIAAAAAVVAAGGGDRAAGGPAWD